MELFVALADTLHFRRASERLGIPQSALSRGIQRLEQDIGVLLFERNRRVVRLTPAGEAFRGAAEDLLDRARAAAESARGAGHNLYGHLVLGVGICGTTPPVGKILKRFMDAHPGITVALRSTEESMVATALGDESIHAVITSDFVLPNGIHSVPVFRTELKAAVPECHPLAEKSSLGVSDLHRQPITLPCRRQQPLIFDRFQEVCSKAGVEPRITLDVQTLDQLLGTVGGGAGLALVPVPEGMRYPGIRFLPLDPPYPLTYVLGWRRTSPWVEALRALVTDSAATSAPSEPQGLAPRHPLDPAV